jgi:hypothetical protein
MLGMKLSSNKIWLSSMIGIIGIGIIIGIIKKFTVMPYPIASYGKLHPLSLDLPVKCNALLYTSDIMDQHSFLSRTVEIVTTIHNTDTYTIVVSPKLLREYGAEFTKCAVVREIKKYSSKSALKTFLLLVLPLEVLASLIMCVFIFRINLNTYFNAFTTNFILPFIAVIIFAFTLYLWNRFVSKQDIKLDRYLLTHFSSNVVKNYIEVMNELQSVSENENSKKFNQHYSKERIKKII